MEKLKTLGNCDFNLFYQVFKNFEKAPFFEKWEDKEIEEEFSLFQKKGSIISYEEKGVMTLLPNKKKELTLPYDQWGNFLYLSDIIVKEEERNQGIGSMLFDYLLDFAKQEEFDSIYFRTNLTGSMSESLGRKRGFVVVRDQSERIITEKVSFLRQSGNIEYDDRKYLVKELNYGCN